MLKIDNISVSYGQVKALLGVSIEVNDGEIVSIIGSNGAGKSSLMKMMIGLLKPQVGYVNVCGEKTKHYSAEELSKHISLVYQNPEDMLISREERRERLGTLKGQLSGLEANILELYLRGYSYVEIAEQVNRSPKAVDNAVQRIRRKVARHLFSGDFSES